MKRRSFPAFLILFSLVLSLCSCGESSAAYTATRIDLFDTVCTVTGYAGSRERFESAADEIFALLERCDALFNIYSADGEENGVRAVNDNAGKGPVRVPPEVIGMLSFSAEMCRETGGAVNVMIGAVTRIWHEYREADANALPPEDMLREAAKHISMDSLVIDAERSTVYISDPEASLDIGAIAKGYAAGLIKEMLPKTGLSAAVINLGGAVLTYGEKPDGSLWRVAIEHTDTGEFAKVLELSGPSVSTSGDYQRYYTVDDVRYHHIIDPATLRPAGTCRQVSVICDDPALADAMSTALFVLGPENAEELIKSHGLRVWWIDLGGEVHETDGRTGD